MNSAPTPLRPPPAPSPAQPASATWWSTVRGVASRRYGPPKGEVRGQKEHLAQRQKEHASSVLPFVARVWHQPSHSSTAVSATWLVAHGFAISLQKEHAWHLQSAQCSAALAGLQDDWHAGKGVSPYAGVDPGAKTHCSPAAGAAAATSSRRRRRSRGSGTSGSATRPWPWSTRRARSPRRRRRQRCPNRTARPRTPGRSRTWQRHSPHISRDAAFAASSARRRAPGASRRR